MMRFDILRSPISEAEGLALDESKSLGYNDIVNLENL